jgi:hypothetical protein
VDALSEWDYSDFSMASRVEVNGGGGSTRQSWVRLDRVDGCPSACRAEAHDSLTRPRATSRWMGQRKTPRLTSYGSISSHAPLALTCLTIVEALTPTHSDSCIVEMLAGRTIGVTIVRISLRFQRGASLHRRLRT